MNLTHGGVMFDAVNYARILAFTWFVMDKTWRCQEVKADDFTAKVMNDFLERNTASYDEDDGVDVSMPDPPKLDSSLLIDWKEAVMVQLQAKQGYQGVPLSYVIRRDLGNDHDDQFANNKEQLLPLSGQAHWS